MSEWISVDDELPKNGNVFIADDNGLILVGSHETRHDGPCWRIGESTVLWDHDFNLDFYVHYWMPMDSLPPPPTN